MKTLLSSSRLEFIIDDYLRSKEKNGCKAEKIGLRVNIVAVLRRNKGKESYRELKAIIIMTMRRMSLTLLYPKDVIYLLLS